MGARVTFYATQDAALANSFANDPAILPHLGFADGATVDVTSRIGDSDLLFLTNGKDAMMCFQHVAEGWEFHSMFRPSCRGRAAINAALAMFNLVGSMVGDFVLIGICPVANRGVRWFCRQLGMTSEGIRDNAIVGPVEYFRKDLVCL